MLLGPNVVFVWSKLPLLSLFYPLIDRWGPHHLFLHLSAHHPLSPSMASMAASQPTLAAVLPRCATGRGIGGKCMWFSDENGAATAALEVPAGWASRQPRNHGRQCGSMAPWRKALREMDLAAAARLWRRRIRRIVERRRRDMTARQAEGARCARIWRRPPTPSRGRRNACSATSAGSGARRLKCRHGERGRRERTRGRRKEG